MNNRARESFTGKNIVVCCDGTGNEIKFGAQSNVLDLYLRLDKSDPSKQIAFYDPGLGTVASPGIQTRTLKALTSFAGLAFAYGLSTNIKQAYLFLMRNYEPNDRIFLYGFSRGAYTVRALAGLIYHCGLLDPRCENLVDYAMKVHRMGGDQRWKIAARFRKYFPRQWADGRGDGAIHFMGVWDTVKSVGFFRRYLVLPHTKDLKAVAHGRHAVSISEKRRNYQPNLWTPPHGAEISNLTGAERFQEVWFPGVHSDVGGGYEDPSLSDVALRWMLDESDKHGILLRPEPENRELAPNPNGKIHNPLKPIWWLLGWKTRRATAAENRKVMVHPSVETRRQSDKKFDALCRQVLPESFEVV